MNATNLWAEILLEQVLQFPVIAACVFILVRTMMNWKDLGPAAAPAMIGSSIALVCTMAFPLGHRLIPQNVANIELMLELIYFISGVFWAVALLFLGLAIFRAARGDR